MCAITSVPTTRVSDILVRQRLLSQVQLDQSAIYKLQNQVSTGQRITFASEDPAAALRALAVQGLIDRKTQVKSNLTIAQSFLNVSDSTLGDVSNLLTDIRAQSLAAVGDNGNQAQRNAALLAVKDAISRVTALANQQFRGRYLFAGSQAGTLPFVAGDNTIRYTGDQKTLYTFSDIDALFESNISGDQVFGAMSKPVAGADLNPALTDSTPLSQLLGGRGIRAGSIAISDGTNSSIVNISGASTIGDVARLIETHPPAGRTITARVTGTGLKISIDSAGGGNLTIAEVGGGTTASELGIKHLTTTGTAPIVGSDLNPRITRATELATLLGTKATATLSSSGANNDITLQAAVNGAEFNGVTVQFVDDNKLQAGAGLEKGHEVATYYTTTTAAKASLALPGQSNDLILTATTAGSAFNGVKINVVNAGDIGNAATVNYNASSKVLTIGIDDSGETSTDALIAQVNSEGTFTAVRDASEEINTAGGFVPITAVGTGVSNTFNSGADAKTLVVRIASGSSTAANVVDAINAEGTFTARIDFSEANNDGTGEVLDSYVSPTATALSAGGSGRIFDQASGLLVTSGGNQYTIDISQARTIDDLLNAINGSQAGLAADINALGTGIDVRSRVSGAEFTIGENGGTTATDLGIRSLTTQTALSELNYGAGVQSLDGADFAITRRDGVELSVDIGAGVGASARLNSSGADNALLVSRVAPGVEGNQYSVQIVDGGSGATASVSLDGNTLKFSADLTAGFTAADAKSLLEGDATLSAQFAVRLDTATEAGTGAGNLAATAAVSFSGGKSQAVTVGDVLDIINNDPNNLASGSPLVARLASVGNGIELVDNNTSGSQVLTVKAVTSSIPAQQLGLLAEGQTSATAQTPGVLRGSDPNPLEVRGVFTALLRLRDALEANDSKGVQRSIALLDDAVGTVNSGRAEIGLRLQSVDAMQSKLQDEDVDLKAALSKDLDVDMASVISELLGRQQAFEASLQATASIAQMTLMNYL